MIKALLVASLLFMQAAPNAQMPEQTLALQFHHHRTYVSKGISNGTQVPDATTTVEYFDDGSGTQNLTADEARKQLTSDVIVEYFDDGSGGVMPVLFVHGQHVDAAIVTIFYWQEHPTYGKLLRSSTSTVDVIEDVNMALDNVPATKDKIKEARVRLVNQVAEFTVKPQ